MNSTTSFYHPSASPTELVDELIKRITKTPELPYEGRAPECTSLVQRLSEVILNPEEGSIVISAAKKAIRQFFKWTLSQEQLPDELKKLSLIQATYIEMAAYDEMLSKITESYDFGHLTDTLRLTRNEKLKKTFTAVIQKRASNVAEIEDFFKALGPDNEITRQSARTHVIRLSQLGLIKIDDRKNDKKNSALVFRPSATGYKVAKELGIPTPQPSSTEDRSQKLSCFYEQSATVGVFVYVFTIKGPEFSIPSNR